MGPSPPPMRVPLAGNWEGACDAPAPWTQRQALVALARLTGPIAVSQVLNVLADRATLAYVGQWDFTDRAHFDGAAMGKMYSNITGLSLGISASIGLATFCAQAHGEGRSLEMNAVYLRRAALLLCAVFLFALLAAVVCEPVLLLAGQPPAVAHDSALFAQVQLLGIPSFWAMSAIGNALNSAKITRPTLFTSFVGSVAQLLLCAIFTHPRLVGLGYLGISLGRAASGWVALLVLVTYVKCNGLETLVWKLHPHAEPVCIPGALRSYLNVSIPSALIIWSEWWAFEVLTLFVGLTPNPEVNLGAHGAMFNAIVVAYMTFTGTSTAVCALVGNLLGEGRNADVMPLLRAARLFSISTSVIVAVTYEWMKRPLAAAFTQDEAIRQVFRESSLGVVLSVPLYAQLMTFYGALRGASKQLHGILGTVVGYWIVGLPLGGILGCYFQWPTPLVGVWLGNVASLGIAAVWVSVAVFAGIDWLQVKRVTRDLRPRQHVSLQPGTVPAGASLSPAEQESMEGNMEAA